MEVTKSKVAAVSDYYPFGMLQAGNSTNSGDPLGNKYLYNGVEKNDINGLNVYETFFRQYDPALGKFNKIDPLAAMISSISPYHFGFNNPIRYNDPLGLMGNDETVGADGLTNSQWLESSRPGADPSLARDFRMQNWQDDVRRKRFWREVDRITYDLDHSTIPDIPNFIDHINIVPHLRTYKIFFNDRFLSSLMNNEVTINKDLLFDIGIGLTALGYIIDGVGEGANYFQRGNFGIQANAIIHYGKPLKVVNNLIRKTNSFTNGLKIAGRYSFYTGALKSTGEFVVNPTVDQGMSSGLDILWSGIGMTAAWPAALIYFGDKALYQYSPTYKSFSDEGFEAYSITRERIYRPSGTYIGPCFIAGTKILLNDGKFKNIEKIIIGDSISTYNLEKQQLEMNKVSKIFKHEVDNIYKLILSYEVLFVTAEHPFYVIGKDWVKVMDLQVGDLLMTYDGNKIWVDAKELFDKNIEVYNIHVDVNHNYFVETIQVLVHNK